MKTDSHSFRFSHLTIKRELKLDEVVTKRIGIGDVESTFEAMQHGEVLRSVIVDF